MNSSFSSQLDHGFEPVAAVAEEVMLPNSKLRRLLRRYERNQADVEDIIQDALVEALRSVGRFNGTSSLTTWFFGVALNVARHHVARRVREAAHLCALEMDEGEFGGECGQAHEPGLIPGPAALLEFRQFLEHFNCAMTQLPCDLRDTFNLACLHELSYQEVATRQGIPVGTVRSRVNRARAVLREALP